MRHVPHMNMLLTHRAHKKPAISNVYESCPSHEHVMSLKSTSHVSHVRHVSLVNASCQRHDAFTRLNESFSSHTRTHTHTHTHTQYCRGVSPKIEEKIINYPLFTPSLSQIDTHTNTHTYTHTHTLTLKGMILLF